VVANPRIAAGATVVSYWLRLFRWTTFFNGHDPEENRLRMLTAALDSGSHSNARPEPRAAQTMLTLPRASRRSSAAAACSAAGVLPTGCASC
jgi:hypothetical protein